MRRSLVTLGFSSSALLAIRKWQCRRKALCQQALKEQCLGNASVLFGLENTDKSGYFGADDSWPTGVWILGCITPKNLLFSSTVSGSV